VVAGTALSVAGTAGGDASARRVASARFLHQARL